MPDIYATTFMVTVLSNGPFVPDGSGESLAEINYAISQGDCIGDVVQADAWIVPPDQVRAKLLSIGNDGTFFEEEV